jgi:23S rRNA pseudouridine1911/1915/1917 synthase
MAIFLAPSKLYELLIMQSGLQWAPPLNFIFNHWYSSQLKAPDTIFHQTMVDPENSKISTESLTEKAEDFGAEVAKTLNALEADDDSGELLDLTHEERIRALNAAREVAYDPEEYGLDEVDDDIRIYEHHRVSVDPGQAPLRVDVFLTDKLKQVTRSRIKSATLAGFIKVNDNPVKASYKVKPYDEVSIILPYPPENTLEPENIPLDISYEDERIILVNKPAGMVVHPGSGNFRGTLVNALLWHVRNNLTLPEDERNKLRPGLVHRIDKDTSGLLVIAKDEPAYNMLAKQFFLRTTERRYYAIVWGNVEKDRGTIVGHIGRSPTDRKRFQVYESGNIGRHAVTHYEVLQRFGICTLIRCKLETGRTHQIRVHMKYIGHILFNDSFYGGNRVLRGKSSKAFLRFINECFTLLPRQALHAKTLGFIHPTTSEFVHFECPLPPDFKACLFRMYRFFNIEPLTELKTEYEQYTKEISLLEN